jgi:hypothetical protein
MPAIYFFGSHLATPLYPGTVLLKDMSPSDLWRTYVRPMGAEQLQPLVSSHFCAQGPPS